jgi:hypothetical protein
MFKNIGGLLLFYIAWVIYVAKRFVAKKGYFKLLIKYYAYFHIEYSID